MKGIIFKEEKKITGYMDVIMLPFKEIFVNFNWLITNCDVYCKNSRINNGKEYIFIEGKELLEIISTEKIQFVWGVFSGFKKEIPLNNILMYELPFVDGNENFWKNKIIIQHPLAEIEIVSFDSSFFYLSLKMIF